jgi:hypothetical protein
LLKNGEVLPQQNNTNVNPFFMAACSQKAI